MKSVRLFLILLLLVVFLLPSACNNHPSNDDGYKAAIVDQLYLRQPNPAFISRATRLLESAGFEVAVWQGNDITVDFYRRLPSLGYRLIVLRVHSGTLLEIKDGQPVEMLDTYLFTAENYTTGRYQADQLTDKISYAVMDETFANVFAVNSEFIKNAKGDFDRTIILSMGCESYRHDDLRQAFIAKGASVYIGWNNIVTLEYVDRVTLDLLNNICSGVPVGLSVSKTMAELGHDPYFDSYLKFYPESNGGKTLEELTQ